MLSATGYRNICKPFAIAIGFAFLFVGQFIFDTAYLFACPNNENQDSAVSRQKGGDERDKIAAANKILNKGEGLFTKGDYWSCAQELIIIMDFFPKFDKMDQVVNLLGHCLFQEELTEASIRMFNYLLKTYKTSEYIPGALLGLERGFYQQNDYKQALRVFYVILKKSQQYAKFLMKHVISLANVIIN